MSWDAAALICQADGASLSDDTPANHDIVMSYGANPWIGATDRIEEGKWVWQNGLAVTDFYFRDSNTGISENSDCLNSNWKGNPGRWQDSKCEERYPFLCKRGKRTDFKNSIGVCKYCI